MYKNLFLLLTLIFAGLALGDPNSVNTDANKPDLKEYLDEFYSQYSEILKAYVSEDGLVNYPKLRRYRLELIPQTLEFSNVDPEEFQKWPDDARKAFWVNAYNFYVLKIVTDNYPIEPPFYKRIWWPVKSTVHIDGFYDKIYVPIMGLEYSLSEIENRAVYGFNDPNVAFTLNRGTLGSPKLPKKPYRAENFDEMADDQIKTYLSRDVGFEINLSENKLLLAEQFERYSKAFIDKYGSMKKYRAFEPLTQSAFNFIDAHGPAETKKYIENVNTGFEIKYQRPNWRFFMKLNEIGIN